VAVGDDGLDLSRVGDVGKRVRFQEDEIGESTWLDRSKIIEPVEEFRRVESSGLQRLERGEAGGDEPLQFKMEADAGNHIDACGSVRASQKRNIGGMEFADNVQLVVDELFADGKRVNIQGIKDSLLRRRPMFDHPGVGSIGEIGIFCVVDGVDEPLASLPKESRTLPDLVLGQQLNDAIFESGVVGSKEHAHSLFSSKVLGLVRRAGLKDADEMLEGVLASGDSLRGADSVWNMAFKYDAHFLCFVGDGEIGFPGNSGLDLDEVGAAALKHIDSLAAVVGSRDGNGCLVMGGRAIEHRAGDEHAGAEKSVCGDLVAGVENRIKCAAHVADTGDAVGEEEWQNDIRAIGGGAVEVDMRVHVPETGDEICAMGVNYPSGLGFEPGAACNTGDSIALNDYGRIVPPIVSMTLAWVMARVCARAASVNSAKEKRSFCSVCTELIVNGGPMIGPHGFRY
jgi:hypothetical protein